MFYTKFTLTSVEKFSLIFSKLYVFKRNPKKQTLTYLSNDTKQNTLKLDKQTVMSIKMVKLTFFLQLGVFK